MSKCYWEKQGGDRLCAVHTLNSLLQGPVYTEVSLASVAHELDAEEKKLLGMKPNDPWESQNVDPDGNFSLPTMEKALQGYGTGVSMVNLDRADIRATVMKDCQSEQAYVCNSHRRSHWYCVRKVKDRWYDFDSLKPAPTFIGDFALSAFLEMTMQSGFTVFVCRPKGEGGRQALNGKFVMDALRLPDAEESCKKGGRQAQLQGHQHLLDDREMESMHAEAKKREQNDSADANNFGNAINKAQRTEGTDWSKMGGGNTLGGGSGGGSAPMDTDMDPELRAAIAASLTEMAAGLELPPPAPEPTEGGITVMVRFKSDEPLKRVFEKTAPLSAVFAYVEYANLKVGGFASIQPPLASSNSYSLIKSGFPKKEKFSKKPDGGIYLDGEKVGECTLTARDFAGREALVLQLD